MSTADVRQRHAKVQGQREQARLKRLQRDEWLSVSCDERKRRRDEQRAKVDPSKLLMHEEFEAAMIDSFMGAGRMFYGGPAQTVRLRCPRCGERACENAPTKTYEAPATPWLGSIAAIPIARGAGQ